MHKKNNCDGCVYHPSCMLQECHENKGCNYKADHKPMRVQPGGSIAVLPGITTLQPRADSGQRIIHRQEYGRSFIAMLMLAFMLSSCTVFNYIEVNDYLVYECIASEQIMHGVYPEEDVPCRVWFESRDRKHITTLELNQAPCTRYAVGGLYMMNLTQIYSIDTMDRRASQ